MDVYPVIACLCTSRQFYRNGYYYRKITNFHIIRFVCRQCAGSISLLPDFLTPYKWHLTKEINYVINLAILSGVVNEGHGFSVSTIYRWVKEYQSYSPKLALVILERLEQADESLKYSNSHVFHQSLKRFIEGMYKDIPEHEFFIHLQGLLCQRGPPMGLFRELFSQI